ncbi:MAG TPA: SCO family protein [Prolixibacteraceae bacterium]|nr:SCO family protein [Prolixibacteraceae bacterium]
MKKLLLSGLFFMLVLIIHAQIPPVSNETEIGIVEKLDQTIPVELKFYNEKNDTVSLGSLINKPTILSFVYFDCPGLCSPLLDGIADVVSKSELILGKDYDIITISFNTKDTPEKAVQKKLNFVQKIKEDQRGSWTYLTGELENIQKITQAVGFKFKPTGEDFAHPSTIIILSPEGKITRYLYGISYLPLELKMAIGEAKKGVAQPTSNKIFEYCFAYDPQSRTYTLQVTRLLGTFVLIMGLFFGLYLYVSSRRNKIKNSK